jgi:N-methylhydantoinase A/oxoprolinase/acetone carboxylase beta subunit
VFASAQDVSFNGKAYSIKKDRFFEAGIDITDALSEEEKQGILSAFDKKRIQIEKIEVAETRIEKAEKAQKAEKKQKKAEKALKKRQKAQFNFDKAAKKHKAAISKYEKLKRKGKLSPVEEEKWLEKITKYKGASEKAGKKLMRS